MAATLTQPSAACFKMTYFHVMRYPDLIPLPPRDAAAKHPDNAELLEVLGELLSGGDPKGESSDHMMRGYIIACGAGAYGPWRRGWVRAHDVEGRAIMPAVLQVW